MHEEALDNTILTDLAESATITMLCSAHPVAPATVVQAIEAPATTANTVESDLIITMASSVITTDLDTLRIDPVPTAPAHITAHTVVLDHTTIMTLT